MVSNGYRLMHCQHSAKAAQIKFMVPSITLNILQLVDGFGVEESVEMFGGYTQKGWKGHLHRTVHLYLLSIGSDAGAAQP